jgi:hypothetical protein
MSELGDEAHFLDKSPVESLMDAVAEPRRWMTRSANNCRWATPTLFLTAPLWCEGETSPWACLSDLTPRVLATTDPCATCPRWEPRETASAKSSDQRQAEAAGTAAVPLLIDWLGGSLPPHETE